MTFKVKDFPNRDDMIRWFNYDRLKTCNINTTFHQIIKTDTGYEVFYEDFY